MAAWRPFWIFAIVSFWLHDIWWKSVQKWLYRLRISRNSTVYVFPKWLPSAILDYSYFSLFRPPTTSSLVGYIIPASGVILIRSDLAEIYGFSELGELAWKYLFTSPFGRFWGVNPFKLVRYRWHHQKALMVAHITSFELSSIRIASQMWPASLAK